MNRKKSVSGKAFDVQLFKKVLAFVKPYKIRFWFTFILTLLLGVVAPVKPKLIGDTIDNFIVPGDANGLGLWVLLIVAFLLIEAVLQFFQTYNANYLGQSVIIDLRATLFRHLAKFKLSFYDKTPIGTLVTRVISDIETMGEIFSSGILIIMGDLLKLVLVILYMFYLDWKLALLSIASIPLLLIGTNIFKNAIKKAFTKVRGQVSKLNAYTQEHLTGMSVVQIFGREEREMQKFEAINAEHRNAHVDSIWANAIFFPVVEVFSSVSIALLVWYGVKGIINEDLTFGVLFEFILMIHMLFRPIRQLADKFNVLQMGMVGSERVFNLLEQNQYINDVGSKHLPELKGDIEFKNVSFAYIEEEYVLRDISFTVRPGETVALVGATGAGKSSIVNLLSRLYEFQEGHILVDGIDIKEYQLQSLRDRIAVVLQDVFLFSDSISNNINLKDGAITDEQIIEAAKAVGALDFINELPGGLSYNVRERGSTLSTGQRQLLAFIRAYVYNPDLLILDEATSSVDSESEEMIQRAIHEITSGRTSIVIAHRLSTIQDADKIIVLDKGRIVEQGTHQQLLEKGGHYQALFELQYK
jgi:ATP-binding cassette subfamily B protein